MIVNIEKAKEAVAAIGEARAKCEAAGLSITASRFRLTLSREDDAFVAISNIAKQDLARAERRAMPIAVGDTVRVRSIFNEVDEHAKILCVGCKLVKLVRNRKRTNFRLDTGRWNSPISGSNIWIDEDDLYRIRRDLMPKKRKR